jgi:hypothetical protein
MVHCAGGTAECAGRRPLPGPTVDVTARPSPRAPKLALAVRV